MFRVDCRLNSEVISKRHSGKPVGFVPKSRLGVGSLLSRGNLTGTPYA